MNIQSAHAPILSGANLVKTYGGSYALAGVDIAINTGESVAIMGASGSGKTTLLHCLAGITTPDAGVVTFQAAQGASRVSELSESERSHLRRESFGFVFQQGLLIPELTAIENIALPLLLAGYPRKEAEGRAQHWLAALGLSGFEARRIGELSGGQAQRVAIARAQVTGATVVFADEPTGALDSTTSEEVMSALLGSTAGQGHALVVVTHDENVAARCSRIIRLHDGRIVADATHTSAMSAIVGATAAMVGTPGIAAGMAAVLGAPGVLGGPGLPVHPAAAARSHGVAAAGPYGPAAQGRSGTSLPWTAPIDQAHNSYPGGASS